MLFARNPIIRRKDDDDGDDGPRAWTKGAKRVGNEGDGSCRRRYIISHFNDNVYTRAYK